MYNNLPTQWLCQIRRKSRFFFLWRAVNAGIMTRQNSLHIFFPFNECSYFVQTTFYQSWNEFKSSVYEIWPDNAVRWVTHPQSIPARSVFHLYNIQNTGDYKNNLSCFLLAVYFHTMWWSKHLKWCKNTENLRCPAVLEPLQNRFAANDL